MDHNISKRSRSPTLSYQDVNGAEARHSTGANARRYHYLLLIVITLSCSPFLLCCIDINVLSEVLEHLTAYVHLINLFIYMGNLPAAFLYT